MNCHFKRYNARLICSFITFAQLHDHNNGPLQVFHGADKDVEWLQRDFGIYVVNMFDTGQASRVLNMSRFSLAHLLSYYCDVEADKQYQLADWRIRYT